MDIALLILVMTSVTLGLLVWRNQDKQSHGMSHELRDRQDEFQRLILQQFTDIQKILGENQVSSLNTLQESLHKNMQELRMQITEALNNNNKHITHQVDKLTETTENRLKDISGQVEKRLTDGFEKTTATFTDIIKRLALIDEAQKKITELSSNMVSLQEILSDRKTRGAFGEVQLENLIANMLPTTNYSFQHTFDNGKRADCVLFLPEPTGTVAVDAKFPLETYRKIIDASLSEAEHKAAAAQFKTDIKRHIQAISEKYILPGETADGAIMFIPAESVFAEIHAHYPELVDEAQQARVWMVSPTTMMAIITTARAVIKDDATKKQVHIIQEHLRKLGKNFDLFRTRMDKLAVHIKQASTDVDQIHISARKISSEFEKIESVEMEQADVPVLEASSEEA